MSKIKCLIVDDEPLAIEVIENHISQLDGYEVVATCRNAVKAFEALATHEIDLMFLDIQMPKLTGTEFLGSIKDPPKTIFTTAYSEYALEGYDLNVVDYLVKPISFQRFLQAVNKVSAHEKPLVSENDFTFVRVDRKNTKVLFDEIKYVEGLRDYLKIHTTSQTLVTKETMTAFVDLLPKEDFLRIHRSYLVSVRHITAFTNHDIEIGEIELPIGASFREDVLDRLG